MKCLFLGEGPTDLGVNNPLGDVRLKKGPMALIVDFLAERMNVFGIDYELLSRGDVSLALKNSKRKISPRPKEVDRELNSIYKSAWYIGRKALEGHKNAAIYFHDPDRTNSEPRYKAGLMEKAMIVGFGLSGFENGIPMIPIPRSEAWLLAYFQRGLEGQIAYNKAERFEKLPANDKSPKSAKKLLQKAVGARTESDVSAKIMEEFHEIDWTRVDMPSFNRFRSRLESVLNVYLGSVNVSNANPNGDLANV